MIWFNIKKLEKRIKENEFSDKCAFKYFMAFAILHVILAYSGLNEESYITLFEFLGIVGVTIWGTYSIFRINSSGDGKDFFKRFFALSWVVIIRLYVYAIMIFIPLMIIYYLGVYNSNSYFSGMVESKEDIIWMSYMIVFEIIYYLMLRNSFRRVSHKISN